MDGNDKVISEGCTLNALVILSIQGKKLHSSSTFFHISQLKFMVERSSQTWMMFQGLKVRFTGFFLYKIKSNKIYYDFGFFDPI